MTLDKKTVLYALRAMRDRDYKPKVNEHTGNDRNSLKRDALDYAILSIERGKEPGNE